MNNVLESEFSFEDDNGNRTGNLRSLLSGKSWRLNERFLSRYLRGLPTGEMTWVEGIRKVFTDVPQRDCESFEEALEAGHSPLRTSVVSLALSGGLDSQFLALDLRRRGYTVIGYTLRSGIPGYCEWEKTSAFAQNHKIPLVPIEVRHSDFYRTLPNFVSTVEEPIYNLHAVSKFLLAEGLKTFGVTRCVSGDGADQVFQGASECDLFRLTKKSFNSQEIELVTPLATEWMIGFVRRHGPVEKRQFYNLSAEKTSTFFPDEGREEILRKSLSILEESFPCAE